MVFAAALLTWGALCFMGCSQPLPPIAPPPPVKPMPTAPAPDPGPPQAEADTPKGECANRDRQLAQLFTPYVEVFSNRGYDLSADGTQLLFTSNRGGGSYQLYALSLEAARAQPVSIAENKDGITDARFTADGLNILFLRDQNSDEKTQLYRASLDGKEIIRLSKASKYFHQLPLMKPDWKTLVYLRGNPTSGAVQLVTQSIGGGKIKVVMMAKGRYVLNDLSPDGDKALLTSYQSLSGSQVLSVNLKDGHPTVVAPTSASGAKGKKGKRKGKMKGPAHARSAVFSGDGKAIYLITDEGKARAGVRRIDAQSGRVLASFYDRKADVTDLVIARESGLLAVILDHGTYRTLRVLDSKRLRDRFRVKLPKGQIRLGRFNMEGSKLIFSLATPSSPSDIYWIDTLTGKRRILIRDPRPGLKALTAFKIKEVKIPSFDKMKLPTLTFLPRRLSRRAKLPVVVDIHGGPAGSASRGWDPLTAFMVAQGYAVVKPNIRGSTGFGKRFEQADNGPRRMDAVKDLAAVNRWVRKQRWADTERIVVAGRGYGGYMAYMALGHQADLWRAAVGMRGIANFSTFLQRTKGSSELIFSKEFGDRFKDTAFLRSISPIEVVPQMKAPLFVYQGHHDPRAPRSEQDMLVLSLRRLNHPVEYMVAKDEGHFLTQRANKLSFVSRSMRFLEQALGLPNLPSACEPLSARAAESLPPPADKVSPASPKASPGSPKEI